jgi:hypothetical protein
MASKEICIALPKVRKKLFFQNIFHIGALPLAAKKCMPYVGHLSLNSIKEI